ncbi:MAG: copper resistance protein NlpE N-terminal domain-containing protein [Tannerella sp.]|jgi:heat shock protein HslJ|nr:copper resistance protein NlpE N-terminal domain-containing protein [Tannerella sp.]
MKKRLFICGISALVIGMVSCKSQKKETKDTETEIMVAAVDDSQRMPDDWTGAYSGILPCADCSGIYTRLELSGDDTYTLKQAYLGKGEDNSFDSSGKFEWNEDGNMITLGEGDDKTNYLVGENSLTMLDREGNKITGELADYYILAKVDKNLVEKYWKPTELLGEPVSSPKGGKEAYMILKEEGNGVNGNAGCNSFNGTYTLKPDNRICFSKMASTQMMCMNMETETRMHQVFEKTDHYTVEADTLVLSNAEMTPLARFVVVHM